MSMKYISDTQENKTFPNYVFRSDITEYTATYMVITSSVSSFGDFDSLSSKTRYSFPAYKP